MDSSVDIELESWKAGFMKTTMDLPEDLIREMKLRAVREGRKLREVAEDVLRRGLAAQSTPLEGSIRQRVKLPIIPCPPGAKPFELTGDRLLELASEVEQTHPTP
jgi:plasmid stability protein